VTEKLTAGRLSTAIVLPSLHIGDWSIDVYIKDLTELLKKIFNEKHEHFKFVGHLWLGGLIILAVFKSVNYV